MRDSLSIMIKSSSVCQALFIKNAVIYNQKHHLCISSSSLKLTQNQVFFILLRIIMSFFIRLYAYVFYVGNKRYEKILKVECFCYENSNYFALEM